MAMVHTVIDFSSLMKFILTLKLMSDDDQFSLVLIFNNLTLFTRLAFHWIYPVVFSCRLGVLPITISPLSEVVGILRYSDGSVIGTTWEVDFGCL